MRKNLSFFGLLIVGAVVAVIAPSAQAQKEILKSPVSEIEQPLTEAKWLSQAAPLPEPGQEQLAQITAVQLKPAEKGLEVILETAGTFDEVLNSETENTLITDIPNAQLRLPKLDFIPQAA